MYLREAKFGPSVEWNPKNEDAAEQAMIDVVDRFDEWRGSRYDLDPETAEQVQERYREIVEEDDA